MKVIHLLCAVAAVMASAACSAGKGDNTTTAGTTDGTPVKTVAVKPPKNGDWTTVVSATPAGGFLMGNPNAKVQLIEYGSMTCPHCREFDETGVGPLIDNYVKSGQVGYEFRNFVRDAFDLSASLIARCNGANSFFPLTRALYKDQLSWVGKIQTAPRDQIEGLQNLGPEQQFLSVAKIAGFPQWAAVRGVPEAKSNKCLTNTAEVDRLVQMTSDATTQYPDFPGTPTFIINGKMVELGPVTAAQVWPTLESKLKDALR